MQAARFKTAFMVAVSMLIGAPSAYSNQEGPVVVFSQGTLKGFTKDGVENFFGIPYAASPAGEWRWKPPQTAASWTGTRDASEYGAACPQGAGLDSIRTTDEDCLFINIQRPSGVGRDEKLPVVVLIHGGGMVSGSGNNENLDALVRSSRVVGVTMNYRLGNLGFLALPALADANGDIGNYGLMDQIAALRWVKKNISAFGGNPEQVTIGGESAGGVSSCQVIASPEGKGLFSRAFMMSTGCLATPKDEAIATSQKVVSEVGCETDTSACLRSLPASKLLDAKSLYRRAVKGTPFLPESGWEKLQKGELTDVPVLIGGNRDEGRSFLTDWQSRSVPLFDQDSYEAYVRKNFGDKADSVLAVFPWPENPGRYTGTYLIAEVMMKNFQGPGGLGSCKTNQLISLLSQKSEVWAYEFAPSDGPGWFEVPGYSWGNGHATELPYLIPDRGNFANNGKALSKGHKQLSTLMISYWGNFIRTGNPNGPGLKQWSNYKEDQGPVMQLKEGDRTASVPVVAIRSSHHCEFWDSLN